MDTDILSTEYMKEKSEQLLNNQEVKDYLKQNNKEMIIDIETYESAGIFEDKTYCLMMSLGIPIGNLGYYDPTGKEVSSEDDDFDFDADHSDFKWIYTPINNFEDLEKHYSTHRYTNFITNREIFTAEQERHIAYLLEFSSDTRIFDEYTMNKLQNELIDNVPLNYEKAMEILKKYYTHDVCKKFVYDFGVDKERFLYLSGINYDDFKTRADQIEIDFNKVFKNYAKDKISDLGYLKADVRKGERLIKDVTYKVNYIDSGIREISPAYCVSPADAYEDESISDYINEQNKDIEDYFGDDPEGLIVCEKEDDKFKVKYNLGQMVDASYPLLGNMTFTDIDKSFYEQTNKYWNELNCDEIMLSGIETELDIGNGSGDGLLKDAVKICEKLEYGYDVNEIKELASNYKELFGKYGVSMQSIDNLYEMINKDTRISRSELKDAVLNLISNIDNLSINDEKISLRDKETTLKPIEYELKSFEDKEKPKKRNKEAR